MFKREKKDVYRLDEVYGVSRDLPLNYVSRDNVDDVFVNSLATDKHIVVFGSSKQGKTSLRKQNLEDDDYVVVMCSNQWTSLAPLHTAILKAAGYTVEQSTTKTAEGTYKITAKLEAKAGIPFVAGGKAALEGSAEDKATESVTTMPLELDPNDVNDIIAALDKIGFTKYIVLEDFHYLPDSTQQDFAVALKAFHEHSPLCFIVVGVWLDENRLIQYNGDLTERVIAVNADEWSEAQLRTVIAEGEALLNIEFDPAFKADLIAGCFESVSVVQVACHRVCDVAGVSRTQEKTVVVGEGIGATDVISEVVDKQSARYNTFLQDFAGGYQQTQYEMYRWLLLPLLSVEPTELEKSLRYAGIRQTIDHHHPEAPINAGNIVQALKSTASLQVKLKIKPIILDYDQTTRKLNVVDRGFLIWLTHQDRDELLDEAGLPHPNADRPRIPGT